jgi:hypothetical protein
MNKDKARTNFLIARNKKYSVGTPEENHKACMNDCRKHISNYLLSKVINKHSINDDYQKIQTVNDASILFIILEKTRMLDYHADLNDVKYDVDGDCFHDFLPLIESSNGLFVDKYEVMRDLNFISFDYRLIADLCYVKNKYDDENVFIHCKGDDFRYFIFE